MFEEFDKIFEKYGQADSPPADSTPANQNSFDHISPKEEIWGKFLGPKPGPYVVPEYQKVYSDESGSINETPQSPKPAASYLLNSTPGTDKSVLTSKYSYFELLQKLSEPIISMPPIILKLSKQILSPIEFKKEIKEEQIIKIKPYKAEDSSPKITKLLEKLKDLAGYKTHSVTYLKDISEFFNGAEDLTRLIVSRPRSENFDRALAACILLAGDNIGARQGILIQLEVISRYPSPMADHLMRMLADAVDSGLVKSTGELLKYHLPEITSQIILNTYLRTSDQAVKEGVKQDYKKFAVADNFHVAMNDPKLPSLFREVITIQRRGNSIRRAFSILKFISQRNFTRDDSELVQFAVDSSDNVSFVDAKDSEHMPGRGVKISGLIHKNLFAANSETEDPYTDYKVAWPHLARDFDAIARTDYVFTRGLIMVLSPGDTAHQITVTADGKKVHYSLVICNDHFAGKDPKHSGAESFYLVPTELLQEKLNGTEIPYLDFEGYGKASKDINHQNLNIHDLESEAEAKGWPVLHIGSGSTFAGGLTNSWKPGKKWFFKNELGLKAYNPAVYSDVWGHTHKGDITGHYNGEGRITQEMIKLFVPFAEASDQVNSAANSLFNRLELLLIAQAEWSKGLTTGRIEIEEFEMSDGLDDDGYGENDQKSDTWWRGDALVSPNEAEQYLEVSEQPGDLLSNPNIYRALRSAYKRHYGGREAGVTDREKYPVYAFGPSSNLWSIKDSPFYLDTFDMKFRVGKVVFDLPACLDGDLPLESKSIWNDFVVPHLVSDSAIRPFHRTDLGLE